MTLLDPHPLPYEGASSTDVSKLIRMDYGPDDFYSRLAEGALEGWDRWNAEWPRPPYHQTGVLLLSRGSMAPGGFEHESRRVLGERGHLTTRLSGPALEERFPRWRAGTFTDGYFNERGGWAESAAVVTRLLALGDAAGVERRADALGSLLERGSRVQGVRTTGGARLAAERVVVCAGAWTPSVFPWLSGRLIAVAQPVLYFGVDEPASFSGPTFPPWAADVANSGWYGFPALPDCRVKVGHHGPGRPVEPRERGHVPDGHLDEARAFLREAIPSLADAPLVGQRVCLYCDTADGDFLIDADPDREGLIVASGGSGHAFKFAPLLGALVADAVEGRANPWRSRFRWVREDRSTPEAARFTGR